MLAEISPVYQTCKLLQMNKTDIKEITSVCSSLNPLQVWTGEEGIIMRCVYLFWDRDGGGA